MSYVSVEEATEQMLKDAFVTALAADSVSSAVRGWHLSDTTADGEALEFPQVFLKADPNVPEGWQRPERTVAVQIDFATFQPDDRKCQTLNNIYDACRAVLDTATWSSASFTEVNAITIEEGGFSGEGIGDKGELINVTSLPVIAYVCLES